LQASSDSIALHLIQQIRDEAHRFAITGHRGRRAKARHTSVLEIIPGIGAKRRRELLRQFGGMQELKRASIDELAKVPGVSLQLAERIYFALQAEG
jgi:excinuclease ABC subunit C